MFRPANSAISMTFGNIPDKRETRWAFIGLETSGTSTSILMADESERPSAAVGNLRFHDLRHTAATYMVTGGIDLDTVKEIPGHATIQMTMRYAHPTPENKRHAVEVLASLFELPREKEETIQKVSPQLPS